MDYMKQFVKSHHKITSNPSILPHIRFLAMQGRFIYPTSLKTEIKALNHFYLNGKSFSIPSGIDIKLSPLPVAGFS